MHVCSLPLSIMCEILIQNDQKHREYGLGGMRALGKFTSIWSEFYRCARGRVIGRW